MDCQEHNLRDFLQTNGHVVLQRVENNNNLRSFKEEEIRQITNGYSNLLGRGSFGEVYKGTMGNQHPVAVKRYIHATRKEDFAKEVIVHSQINHKNVIRLLGCCTEENALMIVMEFVCNGNLDTMLHCSDADGRVPFPLDIRLDIAIESAEVLSYMHSMYSPVLHGDIKPANILLDENLAPKISDFGIARLLTTNGSQYTNNIIGSIGYMDPRIIESGILTPKSDVYSFGVVLLEIITRKKAGDRSINLTKNFNEAFKKWRGVRQMFDKEIANGKKSIKLLEDISKIAAECLKMDDKMRPNMVEVAARLKVIKKSIQLNKARTNIVASSLPLPIGGNSGPSLLPPTTSVKTAKETPPALVAISLVELREITRNFSTNCKIGRSLRGEVFLAVLKDGRKCAVKKFNESNSQPAGEEFIEQLLAVSRMKHDNVVQPLGYCVEGRIRVLAYEYATKGSLHDILHAGLLLHGKWSSREAQSGPVLSWAQRVKIALSAAQGLEFLHEESPHTILAEIKSSNILIFDNDVAKIGDLGLRMLVPDDDLQYMEDLLLDRVFNPYLDHVAPETAMTGQLSTKSDVYSFGLVLLELLTGREPVDRKLPPDQQRLVTWARPQLSRGKAERIVDPRLGEYPRGAVVKMAEIAASCVQFNSKTRPTMSTVVKSLRPLVASTSSNLPNVGSGS